MKKILAALAATVLLITLSGCSSDADVASENVSRAAEQFEVNRRIVFFNGITDAYLLEIEGRCSVETANGMLSGSLEVTCKVGDGEFVKHFLGLSDNVSFLVEQLDPVAADVFHHRVIFKPEVILPYIDIETSGDIEGDDA